MSEGVYEVGEGLQESQDRPTNATLKQEGVDPRVDTRSGRFREATGTTIGTTQQGLLSEDRSVRPAKTSGYRTKQQSNHARPETRLSQRTQPVPRNAMEGWGGMGAFRLRGSDAQHGTRIRKYRGTRRR